VRNGKLRLDNIVQTLQKVFYKMKKDSHKRNATLDALQTLAQKSKKESSGGYQYALTLIGMRLFHYLVAEELEAGPDNSRADALNALNGLWWAVDKEFPEMTETAKSILDDMNESDGGIALIKTFSDSPSLMEFLNDMATTDDGSKDIAKWPRLVNAFAEILIPIETVKPVLVEIFLSKIADHNAALAKEIEDFIFLPPPREEKIRNWLNDPFPYRPQ
jgi:hypothetical protein